MSALSAGQPGSEVLVPHWLAGAQRTQLAAAVRLALTSRPVHPVAVIHLEDVLTELHVAAARDAVWPASAARVRLATGWDKDVLPVRLSAAELASVLALAELPAAVRILLSGNATA
jgi:energy-coupling factor transporter transmembrane protein EcfT